MKKIVRTLCLIAMVVLVATSCKKEEEKTSITVAFDEITGFEAGPSDGSKAWIDVFHGSVFKWNDGDEVAFYNLSKSDYLESTCTVLTAVSGSEGKTRTQFTGANVGAMKDGYFAFYHPDKANGAKSGKLQGSGNRETFTISATQDYNPDYMIDKKSLVMACEAESQGVFSLQHIFGILNIGIRHNGTDTKKVEYITVKDDVKYLAGDVNLKLDGVDAEELNSMIGYLEEGNNGAYQAAFASYVINTLGYNATGQSQTITLNCNNVALNGGGAYRYFFISLRPGALYNGFIVTIHYEGGATQSHHFDASADYLIKPGQFRNIYARSDGKWYLNGAWK